MPNTYLGYVWDDEIFNQIWQEEPDPVLTAMLESGALINDSSIASMIGQHGSIFTMPFYNTLDATESEVNYDGQTDIVFSESKSATQTGIAFGRAKGWMRRNFSSELSGDDPMNHIAKSVARWWQKKNQARIIGLLDGVFKISGDTDWDKHTVNMATAGASSADVNLIGITTINDAITQACGDNKGIFSLAIMHSAVANRLENLQILEFWKSNDANGLQRPMSVAHANGMTIIIDDGLPKKASASAPSEMEYTTYLFGGGFIRTADARLDIPSEVTRDPLKNGGQDILVTRIRKALHPNGFDFDVSGLTDRDKASPSDIALFDSANWKRIFDAKSIPAARLITNG